MNEVSFNSIIMRNNLNNTAQIIALLSFVIGTCFLSFYLYFRDDFIHITIPMMFVIIAIIVNAVFFLALLGVAILNKSRRIENLKTCLIMLLNIPVAILYFYMSIHISGAAVCVGARRGAIIACRMPN